MFIEGLFGGLMYLIVALIFTIFFLWFIFDFYNYLLTSGKYEMIKQDHSLVDFIWIILFKKEFPYNKNKHFEYEIKKEENFIDFNSIKEDDKILNNDKIKENKKIKVEDLNEGSNNFKSLLDEEKKVNTIQENTKSSSITNTNQSINDESNLLEERVNKYIRKIENILLNDYSKDFTNSFNHKGKEIFNLGELYYEINNMSEDEFKSYVNSSKNDFYNWIKFVVKDYDLAKEIQNIFNKNQMALLIKKRYEYFIYLKEELQIIKIKLNSIENSGSISKNAKLADLIYLIESIPINYIDYITELNSIVQYMLLADIKKSSYDNILKTLESMGFEKHLIKVSFEIKN